MTKQLMMQLKTDGARNYPIIIGEDVHSHVIEHLPETIQSKRLVIITDDTVKELYGERLLNAIGRSGTVLLSFKAGEQSKNYHSKQHLEEQMIKANCDRDSLIIALGGGVVGDLAGFIAATYMRGIPYIQIPTTMLAMVDSSIGGKTGINNAYGKNLIGAFWQPSAVLIDMQCLSTLPPIQLINGLIEALKMFMTSDVDFFNHVYQHLDQALENNMTLLSKIVERAIQIKIHIVSDDERENHQRSILNFGHTIGHALEKVTDYTLLHGYAVGLGILVEAKIAQLLGFISATEYQIIQTLFKKLNISGSQLKAMNVHDIINATKNDKKIKSNQVRYVLLKKLGEVHQDNNQYTTVVSDDIVIKALIATTNEV